MAQCKSCKAKIIWMKTDSGKNICVDYDDKISREKKFDFNRMKSHFVTCPDAAKFRKI